MTHIESNARQTTSIKSSKNRQVLDKSPSEILESFNTWAFKRQQPDSASLLLQQVKLATGNRKPVHFVLYWGKGPRHNAGKAELQCLDFLGAMMRRIGQTYASGARVTLIFTDTHAELNGHTVAARETYFGDVAEAAADRGFSTCKLGSLLDQHDRHGEFSFNGNPRLDPIFESLVKSAEKWYFRDDRPDVGAEVYYRSNMREKRVVELAFPQSIFITFNGPEFRTLFPDNLPIFYMYSLKRGCSVKPWFLPEEPSDVDAAE